MENTMDDMEEKSMKKKLDYSSCLDKKSTKDEELYESMSRNCNNIKSEPSDTCLSKPEAVYIKEEITNDWNEKSTEEFEYNHNSTNHFDNKDNDKPLKDEGLHDTVSHNSNNVESESNETYLQKPETIYIKEEVTDDFNGNSSGESEYSSDSSGHSAKDDIIYHCRAKRRTMKRSSTCKVCEKTFCDSSSLTKHMRIHTKKKPYTCEICGKTFTQSTTVKVHMRSHTNEKPYPCKLCGKTFAQSSRVTVHMRSHTKEKPHGCKICGKKFRSSSHVTVHIRTHTKEKPYNCKMCGKLFSDPSSLRVHIRIHTKEKPYPCNICGRTFSQSTSAKKHMLTHNKEKPVSL